MPNIIGKYHYFDFYEDVYKNYPDCTVYFNISGRSTGKTYSTTQFMFDKEKCPYPINKDNLFCLISRDMGKSRKRRDYFKAYGITCDHDFYYDAAGNVVGFNMAITLSETYKSLGTEIDELFKKVRWILFDEFTAISAWDYVDEEITNYLSIISSVTRNRDDVQIILNGNILNNQSVYNPYFEAYGIDWDELEIEIGETKEIVYKLGKNEVKWALHYGRMAFNDDMLNVGKANLVPHNAPALTGMLEPSPYEWEGELPVNARYMGVFWIGKESYFAVFGVSNNKWEDGNTLIIVYFNHISTRFNPCKADYNKYNDLLFDVSILKYFLEYLFTDLYLAPHKVRFYKGRTESEVWKIEKMFELEQNNAVIWRPQGRR